MCVPTSPPNVLYRNRLHFIVFVRFTRGFPLDLFDAIDHRTISKFSSVNETYVIVLFYDVTP